MIAPCDDLVIVADSDSLRREKLKKDLEAIHFKVVPIASQDGLQDKLHEIKHQALLLHENVSKTRIVDLCNQIKEADPSMMIIACLKRLTRGIEGKLFDVGVEDVITEENNLKAVAKRMAIRLKGRKLDQADTKIIRLGKTIVYPEKLLVWNNGEQKQITLGLCKLLNYFIENSGRAISRVEAAEVIWADSIVDPEGKNLDMQIMKLRRIVEQDPRNPQYIRTIRGKGYMLSDV